MRYPKLEPPIHYYGAQQAFQGLRQAHPSKTRQPSHRNLQQPQVQPLASWRRSRTPLSKPIVGVANTTCSVNTTVDTPIIVPVPRFIHLDAPQMTSAGVAGQAALGLSTSNRSLGAAAVAVSPIKSPGPAAATNKDSKEPPATGFS